MTLRRNPAVAVRDALWDAMTGPIGEILFRVVFWTTAAYALLAGVFLRLWAPIVLKNDNVFFMPVAFAMRNGLGFNNLWVNPTGSGQFDWHGIIHPTLMGWLAPGGDWSAINAAVVLLAGAGTVAYLALLWRQSGPAVLKAAAAMIIVSAFIGFGGRPETTAALLMAALIALGVMGAHGGGGGTAARWLPLAGAGLVLGVLGAAHPIAAAMSVTVFAGALAVAHVRTERGPWRYIMDMAAVGVVAVLALVASFLLLYPYDPASWVQGMLAASNQAAGRFGEGEYLKYFVATKHLPFLILTFPVLGFVLYALLHEPLRQAGWFHRAVLAGAALALVLLIYRFPVRIPPTYYNYAVLIPALALVSVVVLRDRLRSWAGTASALCLGAFAAGCALAQGLWVYQVSAGGALISGQKAQLARLVTEYQAAGARVAVDGPILGALDDAQVAEATEVLFFGRRTDGGKFTPSADAFDVVIRAQAEFAEAPQVLPGFVLARNGYVAGRGALSFSKPEHLGYAVYEADR